MPSSSSQKRFPRSWERFSGHSDSWSPHLTASQRKDPAVAFAILFAANHEQSCDFWYEVAETGTDPFSFFDSELLDDKLLALRVLNEIPGSNCYYKRFSRALREDKDVCLAAVRDAAASYCPGVEHLFGCSDEGALPEAIKADRDVAAAALRIEGSCLLFLPEILKNDRDLVLLAATSCGPSLQFASERLRGDKELALHALRKGVGQGIASQDWHGKLRTRFLFLSLSSELQGDEDVLAAAAAANPYLDWQKLREDPEYDRT